MPGERTGLLSHMTMVFLRLANKSLDHPGIAYCHKKARTIGEIISDLRLIYEVLTPDEMRGRVEYL